MFVYLNGIERNILCYQLKQQGIYLSWESISNVMFTQQRITLSFPTDKGKAISIRTTTKTEVHQKQIFDALTIKLDPLGKYKMGAGQKNRLCHR